MRSVVTRLERMSRTLMMTAAVSRSVRALAHVALRGSAVDQRHDGDARLEPAEPEGELREYEHRARDQQRKAALGGKGGAPVAEERRVREHFEHAASEHDDVQEEIGHGGRGGQADGLVESLQEYRGQHREDTERDEALVLSE